MRQLYVVLFLVPSVISGFAQKIEVDRISNKIIILNEGYFRSIAINTNKGVVLIDTREPLEKMEEIKQIVRTEFKTDTFCYIINTHGCPEHILGNPAFPNTPVIMNHNFFYRKKIYEAQKRYVDSMEVKCSKMQVHDDLCDRLDDGRNWRNYCIKALKINPDITFENKMNLFFDSLTIRIALTGLGHEYSTFIYIPEEKFIHVSTLSSDKSVIKFRIPEFLDGSQFLPYQINELKGVISICDSLKYAVPGHGNYYSGKVLKQMLSYYVEMYEFAQEYCSSETNFSKFQEECSLRKRFSDYEIFRNLNEEEKNKHKENIEWLWKYFNPY